MMQKAYNANYRSCYLKACFHHVLPFLTREIIDWNPMNRTINISHHIRRNESWIKLLQSRRRAVWSYFEMSCHWYIIHLILTYSWCRSVTCKSIFIAFLLRLLPMALIICNKCITSSSFIEKIIARFLTTYFIEITGVHVICVKKKHCCELTYAFRN